MTRTFLAWVGGILLGLLVIVFVVVPFASFAWHIGACAWSCATPTTTKAVEQAKPPVPAPTATPTPTAPAEEIIVEECCGTDPLVTAIVGREMDRGDKLTDALVDITKSVVNKLPGPTAAPAVQTVAPRPPAPPSPCPDCSSGRVYRYRGRHRVN